MRYTVGKEYPFIAILFERKNGEKETQGLGGTFLPWEHKLIDIHIEMLTCAEHHKVRCGYDKEDAEPKNDGFIFENKVTVERWHNEYPYSSASYSDRPGHVAHVSVPEGTVREQWNTRVFELEDAKWRLAEIHRGVFQLKNDVEESKTSPDKFIVSTVVLEGYATMLQEFADKVQKKVEEISGQRLVVEPITYEDSDGMRVNLEGHYRVRFESELSEAHMG